MQGSRTCRSLLRLSPPIESRCISGARCVKSAQEYLRKAEECRRRAGFAVHPDDKAGWLLSAQDWQKLARCAEASAEQRGLAAALSVVRGEPGHADIAAAAEAVGAE
jgi:hypothetical protein